MREPKVLVVDDSPAMVDTLTRYLRDHHFQVDAATTAEEALQQFEVARPDLVLTDLRMKGLDGLDLLEEIRKRDKQIPVVIMTAFGNVESAVEAIQRGAYHYVTKPFEMAALRVLLQRAAREQLAREESSHQRGLLDEPHGSRALLGRSATMRHVRTLVARVANAPCAVLIEGESGTGKESVARAIHLDSVRRDAPFLTIDCALRPELSLESELFGHARGAFRGAAHSRRGLFVEANGGTLFLAEVGEMPLALQAKFVRFLQSGEVRALGNETTRQVDVRCIAATRQDLKELVRDGTFREDLYFQLSVVPVPIPALRERQEDISLLVEHFLARNASRVGDSSAPTLTSAALNLLETHSWPGNIRELENLIERLIVVGPGSQIDADIVKTALRPTFRGDPLQTLAAAKVPLDVLERRYIAAVLSQTEGNKPKAAAILGIDPSTLYRRDKQRR